PVAANDARMRMQADRYARENGEFLRVEHPDFVIPLVAGINFPIARVNRQAGEKNVPASRIGPDGLFEVGLSIFVTEDVNLSRIAAGNEKVFAILAESE